MNLTKIPQQLKCLKKIKGFDYKFNVNPESEYLPIVKNLYIIVDVCNPPYSYILELNQDGLINFKTNNLSSSNFRPEMLSQNQEIIKCSFLIKNLSSTNGTNPVIPSTDLLNKRRQTDTIKPDN